MKKEEKKAITYYTLHELYSIGCILWSDERRAKSAEREDSPTDASSKTHASQAMTKAQVRRDVVSFFLWLVIQKGKHEYGRNAVRQVVANHCRAADGVRDVPFETKAGTTHLFGSQTALKK